VNVVPTAVAATFSGLGYTVDAWRRAMSSQSEGGRRLTATNPDLDIDLHIGRRLRARRRLLGLSQPQLAEAVGVKFQQIQKYESGEDRVSASRLWRLCAALNAPADYFYEGLEAMRDRGPLDGEAPEEPSAREDALDLARSYQQLGERPRKVLMEMARSLSGGQPRSN
jgi:transcriptional regulator with XRE-family HTH domain